MKSAAPALSAAEELARTGLHERDPETGVRSSSDTSEVDEAPETELPVPAGELLAGRYLVENIFAEGGMGIVCLGRHAQLEQPVAIKFLRHALAGKASVVERFLNEGRALAALRSEHVVKVMDVGQLDSGRPYLVMEHLEGIDLGALVARDGALTVETAVAYALQVCEPLAEAHALGIVHRDIKPENLFLWSGGPGKDIVKVLDFGLAKQFGGQRAITMTGPQDSIGSPCYMSPEQITTPQSIDSRTDIWSLGVVLHHLLTDALPFDGASLIEVLSHVLSAAPKSLHDAFPERDFDPALDAIVTRCLEKKPEARYQTMAELSEALGDYLAARRDSPSLVVGAEPLVLDEDEDEHPAKLRIPGVHARWPGVLIATLGLAAGALYLADRAGMVRVRDLGAGWLQPARLGADVPLSPRVDRPSPRWEFARGASALRAVPEVDTADRVEPAAAGPTPISDAERTRRQAAYRAYLASQGLTPLREVLERAPEPGNAAVQEPAVAPADAPPEPLPVPE